MIIDLEPKNPNAKTKEEEKITLEEAVEEAVEKVLEEAEEAGEEIDEEVIVTMGKVLGGLLSEEDIKEPQPSPFFPYIFENVDVLMQILEDNMNITQTKLKKKLIEAGYSEPLNIWKTLKEVAFGLYNLAKGRTPRTQPLEDATFELFMSLVEKEMDKIK